MADPRYPPHPLVSKLTGEADGAATKLLGYFGSTVDGLVRVYPSLEDLSVYYAIREDDIVHTEDASTEELPHGGSAIWIKAGAQVERCVNQRTTVEARFLAGDVAARMAKGPAVPYRSVAREALAPGQGPFSIWPCSVLVGACLASNDMPCAYTEDWRCLEFVTVNSCLTCAGYTCVRECNPTRACTGGQVVTLCGCQVWSRDVCPR